MAAVVIAAERFVIVYLAAIAVIDLLLMLLGFFAGRRDVGTESRELLRNSALLPSIGEQAATAELLRVDDPDSPFDAFDLLIPFLEDTSTIAAVRGQQDLRAAAFAFLNALPSSFGSFGLFDRGAVVEAGGRGPDLITRLHRTFRASRRPYRIAFVPAAEPSRISLSRIKRCQRDVVGDIRRNVRMLLNPRYGTFGLLALPYVLFAGVLAPVVELLGYELTLFGVAFGSIDVATAVLFLIVSIGFDLLFSITGSMLEELSGRRHRPLIAGRRQIEMIWRARGVIDGLLGRSTPSS